MNNQLTTIEQNPLAEIENTNKLMQALMKLPHYQKMGPDNVFAIVAKARSLNMDPIYALNGGLFSIKGKIGMPAEAMAAMIREKGHSITKDKTSTDTCCILHGKRCDNGDTWTIKFSIEDAKRAGIYAQTWEKYPQAMVYARSMSFLARQLFADVIKGAGYTRDELMEISLSPSKMETAAYEEIVEKITQEQVNELSNMLSICDADVISRFEGFIKNPPVSANSLADIPLSQFNSIKNMVKKRYDEAIAKMSKALDVKTEAQDNLFNPEEFEMKDAG